MKKFLEYIIAYTFKMLLSLRYKITIRGADKLNPNTLSKKGGVLFLPNHPTYFIDPIIVTLAAWPKYPIRPMIVEYMYYAPVIHWLMRFMNALPVPNFANTSNSLKRKQNDKITKTLVEDLKAGQNFLIYPAGKVKHTAYESVGAASAVHRVLQEAPETNIVLMRIKGLWGSSFSRAVLTTPPTVTEALTSALKVILKNLIFFTPRREVIIEIEVAPADFPYKSSRLELNRYIEKWFNRPDGLTPQKGGEPGDSLVLVSYSRWRKEYLPLKQPEEVAKADVSDMEVPDSVKHKVIQKISEMTEYSPSLIKMDMSLSADLGMDSLDTAELAAFIQSEFEVKEVTPSDLTTVAKLLGIAAKKISCKRKIVEESVNLKNWFTPRPNTRVQIDEGITIPEVFLKRCSQMKKQPACVDLRVGVQSYAQMKLRVLIIAEYIKSLPGEYVGILLPASVAANILVLGCQLAGKIPLMINWTVGPRHLESVVALSKVEVVLTAWSFLDRLNNIELNGIEEKLVMLEDVGRSIGLLQKMKAVLRSKRSVKSILRIFNADKTVGRDIAVLLFTSGTESLPKGVPLSHTNILEDLRSSMEAEKVYMDDIIYGILPPFHSFGFTISGILGLLLGTRVAYFPDPTDGKSLAKYFEEWKVTLMCGAPTFIKGMLKAASSEQLKSMRLCVTGAEKAPPDLLQLLAQFGKEERLIEGYGITECAPVLTLNPYGALHKGVGKAIPGVELCVVHPETFEILPRNSQGLILARGPNIFSGYLNPGLSSPFAVVEGKEWYKTGDLGFLDEQGYLTISGRLKRFVKIGGEMISLASLEDVLLQMALKRGWSLAEEGPLLAVCAKEVAGDKTKFYLFTRFEISLDEVNRFLREEGFSNLVRMTEVILLHEIPIMGTGKINYRQLESKWVL